jgi:low temperature requirement protein LtrA
VGRLITPLRLRAGLGEQARKVSWLELFFDLIFVAAVAQVAEPLRHHYTFGEFLRLTPLFALIWWAWTGHTVFATRFDTDDAAQRVLTLVQMFAIAAMAANAKDALDSRSSAGFAAAYAAVRLVLVAQYWRARRIPEARPLTSRFIAGYGVAALLWLISALTPAPVRFGLWAVAFVIDLGTPWLTVRQSVAAPPNAAHLPERFGLFTIILLGESLVAVMQGMESQDHWTPAAAASAFLGLSLLFLLWWWYFDGVSGASERPVRTRGDARRFHVWSYAHFPLYLGIIVAGVGVRRIVASAAVADLGPAEAMLLATAVGAIMGMLALIGATAASRIHAVTSDWVPHLTIAVATIALGLSGVVTSPLLLILTLTTLCFAQLVMALRVATTRQAGATS